MKTRANCCKNIKVIEKDNKKKNKLASLDSPKYAKQYWVYNRCSYVFKSTNVGVQLSRGRNSWEEHTLSSEQSAACFWQNECGCTQNRCAWQECIRTPCTRTVQSATIRARSNERNHCHICDVDLSRAILATAGHDRQTKLCGFRQQLSEEEKSSGGNH